MLPRADALRAILQRPLDYLHPERGVVPPMFEGAAARAVLNRALLRSLELSTPDPREVERNLWSDLWVAHWRHLPTIARLMADAFDAQFIAISAVLGGVKDIREAVDQALLARDGLEQRRTIVFVDEVHRFNKSQQDAFLPHVESGLFTFIGATTENPSFEVNSALLSRAAVYVLQPMGEEDLRQIIGRAQAINAVPPLQATAADRLIAYADGDARRLLNTLETLAVTWRATAAKGATEPTQAAPAMTDAWLLQVLATADFEGPEQAIAAYLQSQDLPLGAIGSVCLACAGPVSGDLFRFTNNHWRIDRAAFCQTLQIDRLLMVNDFSAMALGMTRIADHERVQVCPGEAQADRPALVIGAGLAGAAVTAALDTWPYSAL